MKRFILKIDDFRLSETPAKFERLIKLCDSLHVPMSIGVIGNGLRGGRFQAQEQFSAHCDSGAVELWNHSFSHKNMLELDDAEVAWELATTNSLCEQMLGHKPVGFGAPFNKCDSRVQRIATEQGLAFTYESAFRSEQVLTPEYNVPFDGQPTLTEFIKRVERKALLDTLIVQVHPGRWLSRGFEQLEACLLWLKDSGYGATTARAILSGDGVPSTPSAAKGSHDLLVARLSEHWAERAPEYDAQLANFSSYFFARFRANSRDIRRVLRQLDADLGARNVVDVGCGLAQWSLPFFEFNRDATLWAFDTNRVLCDALTSAHSAKLVPYDLRVTNEDFTSSTRLPKQGIDRIVCANALNYIPTLTFAQQANRITKNGSQLILLNQTSAFNRLGVLDALTSGNVEMAKERAMSALRQELVRLGFVGFKPPRSTPSAAELEAVFYAFGFQLGNDFGPAWERTYLGEPTFEGLVFERHSWTSVETLAPASRLPYRRLLCQAGFPELERQLFPDQASDPLEPTLQLLLARAGYDTGQGSNLAATEEHDLGLLVRQQSFARASRLVMDMRTENAAHLFAGATAALLTADVSGARAIATRIDDAEIPSGAKDLLVALCHLHDGDVAGARATVDA